jgi:hypothetical protein
LASFIPNHRKKKERLDRLENDLRRLLELGASQEKLLTAATEVRDCRIRVLRAKQNQIPERNAAERAAFLKLETEIAELRTTPAEAILTEYRQACPTNDDP